MPGPNPKPLGTHTRARNSRNKSSAATLVPVVNPDIPPMPPARDWLQTLDESFDPKEDESGKRKRGRPSEVAPGPPPSEPEWNPAVTAWWHDIWSSPMSAEFHESDVHGLYLACFYLHTTLSPWIKMSDRLAAASKYEAAIRNFGLNPMSRRSLQWEIAKVDEAHERASRRGGTPRKDVPGAAGSKKADYDPRRGEEVEKANPFKAV